MRIVGVDQPKGTATTAALELAAETPALVGLLLEGTRDQLPVYCCSFSKLRIDGRAIPERMVLFPEDAGIGNAEIQWVTLTPGPTLGSWNRERLAEGARQWTLEVLDFPGEPPAGVARSWGTVRYAAAIRVTRPDGKTVMLETTGWSGKTSADSETGPGFVLSRAESGTLAGQALSFARLPVRAGVPVEFTRARIALAPEEMVLGSIEELGAVNVPRPRPDAPLDAPSWSWLFEPVRRGAHRRTNPDAALVDPTGRAIPHAEHAPPGDDGVRSGDVLLADGRYAILEEDDGDGWLDEGDPVIHAERGTPSRGSLAEVKSRSVDVIRVRSFLTLRENLRRAGYPGVGRPSPNLGPEIFHACTEFQRDHKIPETGLPDSTTVAAVQEFVRRLDAADSTGSAEASAPSGSSR